MKLNGAFGPWAHHDGDSPGPGFDPRHRQCLDMPVVGGDLRPYRLRGFEGIKVTPGKIRQYATSSGAKVESCFRPRSDCPVRVAITFPSGGHWAICEG
jgi:hypothetical protein